MAGNDSYTKLLLHCDGVDGSTTFTDSSLSTHTVTATGNAQIDTAYSKFGDGSLYMDGTGDYLTLDGSSDFAFGTGDFSIDFWARLNTTGVAMYFYDSRPSSTQGAYAGISVSASNVVVYVANSAARITGTTAMSTGIWYHIAATRTGTSTKLFLNGTQEGSTYTDSTNYINPASRPLIGGHGFGVGTNSFNGWMDEIRVSKGIARWTSAFTPPPKPYN